MQGDWKSRREKGQRSIFTYFHLPPSCCFQQWWYSVLGHMTGIFFHSSSSCQPQVTQLFPLCWTWGWWSKTQGFLVKLRYSSSLVAFIHLAHLSKTVALICSPQLNSWMYHLCCWQVSARCSDEQAEWSTQGNSIYKRKEQCWSISLLTVILSPQLCDLWQFICLPCDSDHSSVWWKSHQTPWWIAVMTEFMQLKHWKITTEYRKCKVGDVLEAEFSNFFHLSLWWTIVLRDDITLILK